MDTDRKWIIVRVDGKIAAISTDYRLFAGISALLAAGSGSEKKSAKTKTPVLYKEVSAVTADFDEILELRKTVGWDNLMLFGTDFQKKVWRKLWELVHKEEPLSGDSCGNSTGCDLSGCQTRLLSYSDFAELCENRAGVRAVAHAIGLNPISVIIPCHLVVPKETIDRITAIQKKAESTIFKGDDLCLTSILSDPATDFGEYALGRRLKRDLILMEFDA